MNKQTEILFNITFNILNFILFRFGFLGTYSLWNEVGKKIPLY